VIKVTLPYNTDISKNNKYIGRNFRPNPAYHRGKQLVEMLVAKELRLRKINFNSTKKYLKQNPICLLGTVFRPDYVSDPHNFIEAIRDAVGRAIKIDDRYFNVFWPARFDDKKPRIELRIYQRGYGPRT